jgi:homoserine O-acetyltransferase/O-succinyltransferase
MANLWGRREGQAARQAISQFASGALVEVERARDDHLDPCSCGICTGCRDAMQIEAKRATVPSDRRAALLAASGAPNTGSIVEIGMKVMKILLHAATGVLASLVGLGVAAAADYPPPKEGDWVARDFRFHTGEVMPELHVHYTTVGAPSGQPVVVLHGTTGSGASMLSPAFAGELFGPDQPLDATKYYIILPDSIGHGKTAKPSDGLRAKFPQYDYDDLVTAQYRLVTEGLGLRHVRLVLGLSMGGMNAWIWGQKYPGFMDALVPMASQPSAMSSRNWMLRRLIIDSIRNDPDWDNGNYTSQPRSARFASVFYGVATAGGTLAYQKLAPTREAADKYLDERLAAPFAADANDTLYQWAASADYDPSPGLERIQATVLAINSADDERDPPETGIMDRALKRIKNARLFLIPASEDTRGHFTAGFAKFWKQELQDLLATVPRREN